MMYERLLKLYEEGKITQAELEKAINLGWITKKVVQTIIRKK